jgi:hypothetical protein
LFKNREIYLQNFFFLFKRLPLPFKRFQNLYTIRLKIWLCFVHYISIMICFFFSFHQPVIDERWADVGRHSSFHLFFYNQFFSKDLYSLFLGLNESCFFCNCYPPVVDTCLVQTGKETKKKARFLFFLESFSCPFHRKITCFDEDAVSLVNSLTFSKKVTKLRQIIRRWCSKLFNYEKLLNSWF